MIAALAEMLLAMWDAVEAGPRPRRIHVAKLSHEDYPPPTAPLVFLLFADDAPQPLAVAKAARVAGGDALVRAECAALRTVQARLKAPFLDDVPRLLSSGSINGRAVVLMSAVPGELELHHTWSPKAWRSRSSRMRLGLDWIDAVGEATSSGRIDAAQWLGISVEAALARLEGLGYDRRRLHRDAGRIAALWNTTWPAALVHGDFFPGNLLFGAQGRIGVVDWTLAQERGPRIFDPLSYELSFAVHVARTGRALDRAAIEAVHTLPAFEANRARWAARGIDTGLGSQARAVTLLYAACRDGAPDAGRGPIGSTWARLLEAHLELFGDAEVSGRK